MVNLANVGSTYGERVLNRCKPQRLFSYDGVRKCVRHLAEKKGLKVDGICAEYDKARLNKRALHVAQIEAESNWLLNTSAAQEGNTLLDTTAGHQGNELYTGAAQEDKQSLDSAVDHEGGLSVLKANPTAQGAQRWWCSQDFWCQHVPRQQYMCPCRSPR